MEDMIKLDAYDKKILEVLINNSREQISSIAKKVRLKRENVNYKINRLIKEGLIKEFNAIISEEKLKLNHYVLFFELVKLQENTEEKILDYIKNNKFMSWAGTSAGKWSLIFDIVISEKENLDKILNEFLSRFGKFIDDYVLLKLQKGDYFNSKFLGIFKSLNIKDKSNKKYTLDKKDLEILSLLNENSRVTLVDMSEKIGLTPNGVNHRINNLEKNKVIISYTLSLDWKKLDYEWYGIQIKLLKFGEESEKILEDYFLKNKDVIFYYKYLGGVWDYDIGVSVKNSDELKNFIDDFRKNFADIAKISDVFINLGETVVYKLPKGVFH